MDQVDSTVRPYFVQTKFKIDRSIDSSMCSYGIQSVRPIGDA